MKKGEDRAMTDLYDRTQKISRWKIEGSSRNKPSDQPANDTAGINESNKPPSRKRSISDDENPYSKSESGTCNVCNTPCTSCLHRMRVETDTCSVAGTCSQHVRCGEAETRSKLKNPNKAKPFNIGVVKLEGQGESISCVTKYTKEKNTQKADSHGESSSVYCKEESQEKKRFNLTDSQEKSDSNFRVSQKFSACNEKMFCRLDNCDKRDFVDQNQMQDQKVVEVKNQENDNGLIDVNVCDICGDTGREYLLATCSRCSDGAEHTYCMRVRLEKLPEGDWLCEECQLKDKTEKNKQIHAETAPLSTPLLEKENKSDLMNSTNHVSRQKKLRISTDRAIYTSVPPPSPHKSFMDVVSPSKSSQLSRENSLKEIGSSKESISPRKASNSRRENSTRMEVCSPKGSSGGQFMKKSSKEVISPRKTNNLCRENSVKMEICTPKGSSREQFMKKSQLLSRSYSLSHVSSLKTVEKGSSEMLPPKGTMTKHLSFKNLSMKSKVKSMADRIPTKQRISSLLKPTDEPRRFRRLMRSASFKEMSSSRPTSDSVKVTKPLSPNVQVDTQMRANKEKITSGKKDFKGEDYSDVSAQQQGTTIRKFKCKEGSLPKKPKNGASSQEPVRPKSAVRDEKMSRIVLAKEHQANKKPRNILASKERDKELNRLKTAVKTVIPESREERNIGTPDKSKLAISNSGISHTSKNQKAISTNVEEHAISAVLEKSRVEKVPEDVLLPTGFFKKEELIDFDESSHNIGFRKMKVRKDMISQSSTLENENPSYINMNTSEAKVVKTIEVKQSMPLVHDSSLLSTPSETMVIPEQDFVWQGSFEIFRAKTQASESFDGIQAHFSTHVSHNVFEVVAKFSDKLQLEEVPWCAAWPLQCQEIEPSEEHVALFFFARDLESYEVSYSRLLQNLIGDNLALRGSVSGVELFIFPSDKLPEQSQRWNSLFYLWGIFCARKQAHPNTTLNSKKPAGGTAGILPAKTNEDMKSCEVLSIGDNLPKLKVEDGAGSLDVSLESYEKQAEQNALLICLDPGSSCADQKTRNASQAANASQISVVKAEATIEDMSSLPILQRKTADTTSDEANKTLSVGKRTDTELKIRNEQVDLSDETLSEKFVLKRKWEHDGSETENGQKSSSLRTLFSPKIHPFSIDLEKPADAYDIDSTENVEETSLRYGEQSRTGNNVTNVILSDENAAEAKMPYLNLALGNKNLNQKEVRPLPLFPTVRSKEVEGDVSVSLSLTIGLPGSEKPRENAPLKLFGELI